MRQYIYIDEILNGLVFAGDHKGGTRLAFNNLLILKIFQFWVANIPLNMFKGRPFMKCVGSKWVLPK